MNRRAFSLAELILALGLAALATLTLVAVLLGGLRLMGRSSDVNDATSVARELMENIRSGNYAHPLANETFDGRANDPANGGFPPAPYPGRDLHQRYFCRVTTRLLDTRRCLVQVEVTGSSGGRVQLESIVLQ